MANIYYKLIRRVSGSSSSEGAGRRMGANRKGGMWREPNPF